MCTQPQRAQQQGFTIVEIAMGMVLLTIGVLGLISSMVAAQVSQRTNRELATANAALVSAFETFRDSCRLDFDAALATYSADASGIDVTGTTMAGLSSATVKALVILDEPGQVPLLDLNADGDTIDTNVDPTTIAVAVVQLTATWKSVLGTKTVTRKCLLARGDV